MLRATAAAKSTIRRIVRGLCYKIIPVATWFTAVQRRLLAGTRLLVDVSGNTGQYGELVRFLGYAGPIVSFEPQSAVYAVLRQRAAADRNWVTRQVALGADAGEALLRISGNSVSSSLMDIRTEHVRAAPRSVTVATEPVVVSTLDIELRGELGLRRKAAAAVLPGGVATGRRGPGQPQPTLVRPGDRVPLLAGGASGSRRGRSARDVYSPA
jgi:FkbM family methyltransferase